MDRPEVEIISISDDDEFVFKAKVTLRPEPELGEYKGLNLKKREVTITEDDVEKEIERLRDRHGKMESVDDALQDLSLIHI